MTSHNPQPTPIPAPSSLSRFPAARIPTMALATMVAHFSNTAARALGFALAFACALSPLHIAAASIAAPAAPAFDPVAFFTGLTEGVGQLKKAFSPVHRTAVHGRGVVRADGVLVLDQRVEEQGEALRVRQWQLRQTSPGHFSGSLSDASGPVSATISGGRLAIHYTMSGGMKVDQLLTMEPGGQSARHVMKVSKFGMTVATLNETIRRI
jgi:Protein of unknown function (DUF3833)